MGLFDGFRSIWARDRGDGEDDRVHHYVVRFMPWDSHGGFRRLDGWSDLNYPITREEFEYNVANLDPGRYRLYGLDDEGNLVSLPDDESWIWEVGSPGEESTDDVAGKDEQLARDGEKIDDTPESPREEDEDTNDPIEQLRAQALEGLVTSENFMAQYGDKVFREFVLESSSDWDDDDLGESEVDSSVYANIARELRQTRDQIPPVKWDKSATPGDDLDAHINVLAANARDRWDQARQDDESGDSRAQLAHLDTGPDSIEELEMSETDEADKVAAEMNELTQRQ